MFVCGVIWPFRSSSLDSSIPDYRDLGLECLLAGVTAEEFYEPCCR